MFSSAIEHKLGTIYVKINGVDWRPDTEYSDHRIRDAVSQYRKDVRNGLDPRQGQTYHEAGWGMIVHCIGFPPGNSKI